MMCVLFVCDIANDEDCLAEIEIFVIEERRGNCDTERRQSDE
jgi:hypothetical protein